MAGDWIKMRTDLYEDPAVILIAQRVGLEEDTVVGKLHRLWSWADRQTVDGCCFTGTTKEQQENDKCCSGRTTNVVLTNWVDRYVGVNGFSQAMQEVGWLEIRDGSLIFPKFDRHNGKSAKKRALASKWMSKKRSNQNNKCCSPRTTNVAQPEQPEKRREEIESPNGDSLCEPASPATPPANAPSGIPSDSGPSSSASDKAPKTPATLRLRDELFDALAEVTGSDPKLCGSHLGRVCKTLRQGQPPYTPEEVRALPGVLTGLGLSFPITLGSVEKFISYVRTPPQQAKGKLGNGSAANKDLFAGQKAFAAREEVPHDTRRIC